MSKGWNTDPTCSPKLQIHGIEYPFQAPQSRREGAKWVREIRYSIHTYKPSARYPSFTLSLVDQSKWESAQDGERQTVGKGTGSLNSTLSLCRSEWVRDHARMRESENRSAKTNPANRLAFSNSLHTHTHTHPRIAISRGASFTVPRVKTRVILRTSNSPVSQILQLNMEYWKFDTRKTVNKNLGKHYWVRKRSRRFHKFYKQPWKNEKANPGIACRDRR